MQVFKSEVGLHNTSCLDSGSQNILLCWDITWGWYSVQGIQVTGYQTKKKMNELNIT